MIVACSTTYFNSSLDEDIKGRELSSQRIDEDFTQPVIPNSTKQNKSVPTESPTLTRSDERVLSTEIVEIVIEQSDPAGRYVILKDLIPSETENELLREAEETFVQRCMNERGFSYIKNNREIMVKDDDNQGVGVPVDIVAAQTSGYGIVISILENTDMNWDYASSTRTEEELPLHVTGPNDSLVAELSKNEQTQWHNSLSGYFDESGTSPYGTEVTVDNPNIGSISWDTDSCLAFAQRQLFDSDIKAVENQMAEMSLRARIISAAEEDLEYQTILDQWSNCMKESGLEFRNSAEASEALYREYDSGLIDIATLADRERTIATHDAVCYQRHRVADAHDAAIQRAEEMVFIDDSDQISMLSDSLSKAIKRAESQLHR